MAGWNTMINQVPSEVLLVEDESFVRMVAADALADRGIMTWEAGDASEALHILEEHPTIRLIFTDVDMPGDMDGLELARVVFERWPHIALIVTSGAVRPSSEDFPHHGTFLAKPYPATQLVETVMLKLGDRKL